MVTDPNFLPRINEELAILERRDAKYLQETAELFGILEKHPGFQRFQEMLNKRIEALGTELLEPVTELGQTYTQEHKKGAMKGLILARDLTQTILQAQKALSDDGEDHA